MTDQANKEGSGDIGQTVSREDVVQLIAEVSRRVIESDRSSMHCMLALNHLLGHPDIDKVLNEDLKLQIKDLWLKIKSTGIVLADPPILFGYPKSSVDGHSA